MKNNKYDCIFIRYAANPCWPNNIAHKDTRISRLTRNRTRKFLIDEYQEAWQFLMECTSPITKLNNILWAFPRKEALDILNSMDLLEKEASITDSFEYELLTDYIGGEEIETTLYNLSNADKSFSQLILEEGKDYG